MMDSEKYYALKQAMENSYREFNRNPSMTTNNAYKIALTNFQDFCVECTARMVGDNAFANLTAEYT